ncbi:MAG: hypothetical protein H8E57_01470 [Candidatus Cloacimonetes bacterium]|nr:hypothetical protein [Candidatus Cloacimonadota bacterium]
MKLFEKLFNNRNKNVQKIEEETNNNKKKSNPAFDYLQDNYKLDCNIYRKLSSIMYNHSIAASNEFAKLLEKKSNDELIHFFFDYFLSFYVIRKPEYFHSTNQDIYSALIDGIHIEFFGNVSDIVIDSTLQLWTSDNRCFLKTCFKSIENSDVGLRLRLIITIAAYCAGKTEIGATEVLRFFEPFRFIQNSKLSSIDTIFQIVKQH